MLKTIRTTLQTSGVTGLMLAVSRKLLRSRAPCHQLCKSRVDKKCGLEIGGPSGLFGRNGLIPLYPFVRELDNCNFSNKTVWEGSIREGPTFKYDKRGKPGTQFIAEAGALSMIPDNSYDFLLSSHSLEHLANPLKALTEWMRVLAPHGTLVLIVPHKDGTFDHRRPVTTLEHLRADLERQTSEDDLTHLQEILELHDLGRDPNAGGQAAFTARSTANPQTRCLHHHVFDTMLAARVVDCAKFRLLAVEPIRPYHIIIVAEKPVAGEQFNNFPYLGRAAKHFLRSPFLTDRRGQYSYEE